MCDKIGNIPGYIYLFKIGNVKLHATEIKHLYEQDIN